MNILNSLLFAMEVAALLDIGQPSKPGWKARRGGEAAWPVLRATLTLFTLPRTCSREINRRAAPSAHCADKFKGTLPALAGAKAIARGWRAARPTDRLVLMPMSDGGEGFGEVVGGLLGGRSRSSAHRGRRRQAVERELVMGGGVEDCGDRNLTDHWFGAAAARPVSPVPVGHLGPGQSIPAAARAGAEHCLVGVGGSATNDGGFGLARTVGWSFLDRSGSAIESWRNLERLWRIEAPTEPIDLKDISVATDVNNRLIGARGASRVYGPQKGLWEGDFAQAERCLKRLATVFERQFGGDSRTAQAQARRADLALA